MTGTTLQAKYSIGQTVFRGCEQSVRERLECPDCGGTRKWLVTSPAGQTFEIECPRCDPYNSTLPALEVVTRKPYVTNLTIGSVRIDTNDDESPVTYMCRETGVGSGSVYRERELHESEDSAMNAAQTLCDASNLENRERPEVQSRLRISTRNFTDAQVQQANDTERSHRWKLQGAHRVIFDDAISDEECRLQLKQVLETVPG